MRMGLGLWLVNVTVPEARAVMGVPVPVAVTVPCTVTGTASRTPADDARCGVRGRPFLDLDASSVTGSSSWACWTSVMVAVGMVHIRGVQPTTTDRGHQGKTAARSCPPAETPVAGGGPQPSALTRP